MQEKPVQIQEHEHFFKDSYGILKLAADAKLTKIRTTSEIDDLSLSQMQWRDVLFFIKRLWSNNKKQQSRRYDKGNK